MRYIRLSSMAAAAAAILTSVSAGPAVAGDDASTPVSCSTAALTAAIVGADPRETLSLARNCTYHLTTPFSTGEGLPPISQELTIRGNGATIVRDGSATPAFRIFHVLSGGNLRLQDLTVRGGNATIALTGTGNGGGILVDGGGALKLSGVDVIDNTASVSGGGVAVATSGTAVIRRSWVGFNNASVGGGLFSEGTLVVEGSEFGRNHAQIQGGGIDQDGGTATIHATIISRNTATVRGGGLADFGGTTNISESKIANNTTGFAGGGIVNETSLTLDKSEVSGNVVAAPGGDGGGIYNSTTNGVLNLKGSKVIRNSANGRTSTTNPTQAGGIFNDFGLLTLDHSYVRNNASTAAPGGLRTNVPITLTDSTITHNIPTNCVPNPVTIPGCTN
ncbi:hypothetical protein ACIPSJ_28260 [Streptomyces sp. NPDC090088]|uniref:hypothetical protein n=1 Tax=Streptomyces sp. NPDC090088 TaxID=3365944 RepID=UPI00381CC741